MSEPSVTVSFDDLVTVATVGVARKGRPGGPLAGPAGRAAVPDPADQAGALLDAAALLTAARRAGLQPAAGVALPEAVPLPPEAVPPAAEPELSARAARLLRRLGHADAGGVFPVPYSGDLAGPLAAARDAGYVLPAPLLPSLLDLAARDPELRPVVTAMLGPRGRWLAAHRADWRRAVAAGTAADPAGWPAADPDRASRTWATGSRDERRGVLAALRRRDPAAGRELLAAGWGKETAADRAALLDLLRHGLSAADEEFLEAALDDRASGVRETAQEVLARLPGSAFRRRAAERAAPLLRVERRGLRRQLAVTLPAEPDPAAVRDGVPAVSAVYGIGHSGWRLIHVLAAAPPGDWTRRLGLSPADLAQLPVADDLGPHVHAGWRRAVARQRGTGTLSEAEQTAWARALLTAGVSCDVTWRARAWTSDAALAAALPAAIRAERVAGLLSRAGFGDLEDAQALGEEVAGCPVPWPPALADAAVGVLARAAGKPNLPALARTLLELAGRALPAQGARDYAAVLAKLAAPGPPWSPRLETAAETIALRAAFHRELRFSAP